MKPSFRFSLGKKRSFGFTLIELLVVIAIIGVLASIVLVSLSGARTKSRDAARVASLHEMAKLVAIYDTDPANVFWTTPAATAQCTTAYTSVGGCLGIGRSGSAIATNYDRYNDIITPGAANACKGTAAGASISSATCQYSLANTAGGRVAE